ncbi:MAG: hypothetical protein ACFFBS_03635 [Promethearchaeota archaeon]
MNLPKKPETKETFNEVIGHLKEIVASNKMGASARELSEKLYECWDLLRYVNDNKTISDLLTEISVALDACLAGFWNCRDFVHYAKRKGVVNLLESFAMR